MFLTTLFKGVHVRATMEDYRIVVWAEASKVDKALLRASSSELRSFPTLGAAVVWVENTLGKTSELNIRYCYGNAHRVLFIRAWRSIKSFSFSVAWRAMVANLYAV